MLYIFSYNNEEYKVIEVEYGSTISPEPAPEKEGYCFTGWSNMMETMPAHDLRVDANYNLTGDVNSDGKIDILDVTLTINHIKNQTPDNFKVLAADINNDGQVDGSDIPLLVNIMLEYVEPIPAEYFTTTDADDIPLGFVVMFNSMYSNQKVRTSGNTYTQGPRMFEFADGGDFTKGLYFREGYVQFGSIDGHPLRLEAGKKYDIHFNSAMWYDNGTVFRFEILNENEVPMLIKMVSNTTNMNGKRNAIYGSTSTDISFTPEVSGNYLLRWTSAYSETGEPDFCEILLGNVWMKHIPNVDR